MPEDDRLYVLVDVIREKNAAITELTEHIDRLSARIGELESTAPASTDPFRNEQVRRLEAAIGRLKWFAPVCASADGLTPAPTTTGEAEKIPTIKFVRNRYGLGLKDAKDIVDAWQKGGQVIFRSSRT